MVLNTTDEIMANNNTMNDSSVISSVEDFAADELHCPEWSRDDFANYKFWKHWNEGVLQVIISLFGLFGNILSIYILTRKEMRNSFNYLLISLLCFDSLYLFGALLENMRREFFGSILVTDLHVILFPYLLYPAMNVVMSASICMTAAIALERYIAVHYPIDYNQSMNSPEAVRLRLVKYLLPVIVFSTCFNITKFMEAEACWGINYSLNSTYLIKVASTIGASSDLHNRSSIEETTWNDTYFPACDQTHKMHPPLTNDVLNRLLHMDHINGEQIWDIRIQTTALRWNPYYAIYYNNWTRLLILGIIPAGMLMYFNYKIYKDIKLRLDRRRQSTCGRVTANHQARRREEDNLAVVFMGIVGMFLACHALRIFLSLHEMTIIRDAMKCHNLERRGFPVWAEITTTFSHLFLVINSSTNMIIYCILNSTFRQYFVKIVRNFFLRISCGRWHCCPENNNAIGDDRTNGAVLAKNTEHNRKISHVPPTELEMVEPMNECTDDKTKLFDGENNLKVISNNSFKPTSPCPSVNQQLPTALSVNTINGSGSTDFHPKVTEV